MVAAVPANSSSSIDPAAIASALGVTTLDITKLNTMTDVHNCDPMPRIHPIGSQPPLSSTAAWPEDVKAQFMADMKAVFADFLHKPASAALSKCQIAKAHPPELKTLL
ncbi:hypothetical protein PTNB73_10266 [Pyrenophora teres f. teres]|uniref:Uncharacterized protein n=2 Tax=Pyrenophora teres f. teres TaxID=97479 RepID=E3S3J6_PYRTT|nr:hypothetical protein PTT_17049 [Pyrenophora teres f. teres 0-1]KAE8822585.1 hypothetical protein HRS9139_09925 [Pyrenophora teres f. teres]KAE8826284.1 hypothetical protein PTNB85_09229 [Pyrenophora teres f. teres]KAE8852656.1 hypothetical protein PTNB29_10046 [Pyrenophora teres f. teres]KAE8854836.1 hypothetical protein PTNB73_10266 [Pyrenophora teres f. teres]